MTAERIVTLAIMAFGVIFLVRVIPAQVETVDYGRVVPATVPTITICIIIAAALVQFFSSRFTVQVNPLVCIRVALLVAVMTFAVWLMDRFGFEYIAPLLALAVMALIGERRWHWLMISGVCIPLGIWLIVEQLLDRVLA